MVRSSVDDEYFEHRKILPLSPTAKLLDIAGLVWCNRNLTDGAIKRSALPILAGWIGQPAGRAGKAARELEGAGRWDATEEGWTVHGFFKDRRNLPREEHKRRRRAGAERIAKWRTEHGSNGERNALQTPQYDGPHSPLPKEQDQDLRATRAKESFDKRGLSDWNGNGVAPDDKYLIRQLIERNPTWKRLQASFVNGLRREYGAPVLRHALRRLAESPPKTVRNPEGMLRTLCGIVQQELTNA